ncbi:MAG: hypothetical protein JSS49_29640 [Planctomycetes bacterium]|nr:hypothetical protein [Planctomycetota bacterium]
MFSEPTLTSVRNLFSTPGIGLELVGAATLACGVLCYLLRVVWISLVHARRIEADAMKRLEIPSKDTPYNGPYCAG